MYGVALTRAFFYFATTASGDRDSWEPPADEGDDIARTVAPTSPGV